MRLPVRLKVQGGSQSATDAGIDRCRGKQAGLSQEVTRAIAAGMARARRQIAAISSVCEDALAVRRADQPVAIAGDCHQQEASVDAQQRSLGPWQAC